MVPPPRARGHSQCLAGSDIPFPHAVLSRPPTVSPEANVGNVGDDPLTRKAGNSHTHRRLALSAANPSSLPLHGHGNEPLCWGPPRATRNGLTDI